MKLFLGILVGAAVLTALFLTACTIGTTKRPRYSIYMANQTHQKLNDIGVYYGETVAAIKGLLVNGGIATYGIVTLTVPDEATVTWTEESGTHHSPKVKLSGIVPPSPMDMNIWFIIDEGGGVTVKCVRDDDREENQALGRKLNPYREKESK